MEKTTIGNFITMAGKSFPLDCETLADMQNNILLAYILGNIAGDKVILTGCQLQENGTKRAEGYVFLRTKDYPEGEILYWEGGGISAGAYLKKEDITVRPEGYEFPRAYIKRSLFPGIGEENYKWEDFTDLTTTRNLAEADKQLGAAIEKLAPPPLGIVQMWAGGVTGSSLPDGYLMCDGAQLRTEEYPELYAVISRSYTPSSVPQGYFRLPDLRGRFVAGYDSGDADYNAQGKTGGEKTHKLTVEEIPAHKHGENLWKEGNPKWKGGGANSSPESVSLHDQTQSFGETAETGGGAAHENRPPYYAMAYIIRVK